MIFEAVSSTKIKLPSYSATSFSFQDVYWMVILIGFAYSSKPVDNFDVIFKILETKTYPDEFLRPEAVWNTSYQKK